MIFRNRLTVCLLTAWLLTGCGSSAIVGVPCAQVPGAQIAQCGDVCVDTQSDGAHCGACGLRCELGETCVAGACRCGDDRCQADQICLAGTCVGDNDCHQACETGEVCLEGRCVTVDGCDATCGPGQVCIDGRCVGDDDCIDPACVPGVEICINGRCEAECRPACAEDQRCVGGTCVGGETCAGCGAHEICADDPIRDQCVALRCGDDCPAEACVGGSCVLCAPAPATPPVQPVTRRDCTPGDREETALSCGDCGDRPAERRCRLDCRWSTPKATGGCMCTETASASFQRDIACGCAGEGLLRQRRQCEGVDDAETACGFGPWTDETSCQGDQGACRPGEERVERMACGPCGERTRVRRCLDDCRFDVSEWGPCEPSADETETAACGCAGHQTRIRSCVCDGDRCDFEAWRPTEACQNERAPNACGGCAVLAGAPGSTCCEGHSTWACDGTEAVRCQPAYVDTKKRCHSACHACQPAGADCGTEACIDAPGGGTCSTYAACWGRCQPDGRLLADPWCRAECHPRNPLCP